MYQYTVKEPTHGRECIVLIPGASHMDIGQLREILEWEREQTMRQLLAKGPKPVPRFSKGEIAGAIKDFMAYRDRKGINPRYY